MCLQYVSPLITIQIQYYDMTCSVYLFWNFRYVVVSDLTNEANHETQANNKTANASHPDHI